MKTYKNAAGTEGFLLVFPDYERARKIPKEEIPEYLRSRGLPVDEFNLSRNWVDTDGRICVVFRIYRYDENGNHIGHDDYDIFHHDLRIKLLDGVFIEDPEKDLKCIDYDLRETKKRD